MVIHLKVMTSEAIADISSAYSTEKVGGVVESHNLQN